LLCFINLTGVKRPAEFGTNIVTVSPIDSCDATEADEGDFNCVIVSDKGLVWVVAAD
jgi:hypothetical protein